LQQFSTWQQAFVVSLQNLWIGFVNFLPILLAILIIFVLGRFAARYLSEAVVALLRMAKVDHASEKFKVKDALKSMGISQDISKLLGLFTKYFIYLAILITIADTLNLDQVTTFLNALLLYIPRIVVAIIILLVGLGVGNAVGKMVRRAGKQHKLSYYGFLGGVSRWAIIIFSILAALSQANIAPDLIRILFIGIVGMFTLAGGLAFGLGGRKHAERMLDDLTKGFKSH